MTGSAAIWKAARFTVEHDRIVVGEVTLKISAEQIRADQPGITDWTLTGLDGPTSIDGLPTRSETHHQEDQPSHPNDVVSIDHLVVATGDDAKVIDALAAIGVPVRRVRTDARPGLRQTFFRLGETILELITQDLITQDLDTAVPHQTKF